MKSSSERLDEALAAARSAHQDTSRLIRLLATLSEPGSAETVIDRFLTVLSDVFAADIALLADLSRSVLRVRRACGLADDSEILRVGIPLDVESARALSAAGTVTRDRLPRALARLGLTTVMWAPLTREVETTSIIVVGRSVERGLGTLDLPILRSVADRLALVIGERERTNALELLASSGHLLTRHLDVAAVLAEAADLIRRLTGGEESWAVAVRGGAPTARAHSPAAAEPAWLPEGSPVPGWDTISAGEQWCTSADDEPILCVAAIRDDEPCAVLYVVAPMRADRDLIAILANYTAAAIVNATLYDGLQHNEAFLRSITDSIGDMVAIIDKAGRFAYASPSFASELGYEPAELVGHRLTTLVHPAHRAELDRALDKSLLTIGGYPAGVTKVEYRMCTGSREWSWVESAIRLAPGSRERFVFSSRVIDDRKRIEEQLRREARHDSLTGLANRSFIMRLLAQLFDHHSRHIGVLFFDLDGFKAINDRLGHEAGDILLHELAQRVRTMVEPHDNLARLGGDEFLLVLPDIDGTQQVADAGSRIIEALADPFEVHGESVSISASVGGVVRSTADTSPEVVLRDADAAMYAAKKRGTGLVIDVDGRGIDQRG